MKSFSRRSFLRTGAVAGAGVVGLAALAGCGEEEAAVDQMPDPPVADRHYRNFQGVSDLVRRHPELNRLTLHNDGSPVE